MKRPPATKPAFRAKDKDLLDDSVLDEATRRLLLHDIGRQRPPAATHASAQTGALHSSNDPPEESPRRAEGDAALNMAMLTRLTALEKQTAVLHKELKEKSALLITAKDKVAELEEKLEQAESGKLILATKLAAMNRFLADYGLTFVGDTTTTATTTSPPKDAAAPSFDLYAGEFNAKAAAAAPSVSTKPVSPPPPQGLPFDIELAKYQAERLSCSIAHTTVQTNGRTGIIKERDTVYVCVYSDGICVNSGLFRPYGWPLCDAFLADLLEGYFPYEYKDKYPDGFPIEIVDKATEKCPRNAAPSGIAQVGDHGYKPLDREALLRRLPQQYVTASGKLVNVQTAVADFIGGDAALQQPQSVVATTKAANDTSATNTPTTAIKVRFAMGHEVVLKMFHVDTVADLRRELIAASGTLFDFSKPFELCSVYPRRTYDDHAQTLATVGLVPSATLQIKLVVPQQLGQS